MLNRAPVQRGRISAFLGVWAMSLKKVPIRRHGVTLHERFDCDRGWGWDEQNFFGMIAKDSLGLGDAEGTETTCRADKDFELLGREEAGPRVV